MGRITFVILLIISLVQFAYGVVGLRSTFGEVVVENLQIGQTYSMQKLVNLPYRVLNKGDETLKLALDIKLPRQEDLRKGYEVIPDTSWIKLTKRIMTLKPGEQGACDVVVKIPDDKKYEDKKYEVHIWCHQIEKPGGGVAIGLEGRLLLSTTSKEAKPGTGEIEGANLNFDITPYEIYVDKLPLGKKVELKMVSKDKRTFRISNPNDEAYKFKIESISIDESLWRGSMGIFEPGNPEFVTIENSGIEVPELAIKEMKIYLEIPKEKEYAGKNYMFLISSEVTDQPIPVKFYSKIYVTTEKL